MAQPTVSSVHIDAALSNISIAYRNAKYIADQVFPLVDVEKQSDYFYTWTKDFWFRNHVERRGPGAVYAEGGLEVAKTQYVCVNKGLAFPIPWETVKNQDVAVDIETAGAEWLADQFALDREIALATACIDASVWTSSTTLSGTNQWNDYEGSNPLGNVATARQAIKALTGLKPNTLVINEVVYDTVRRHPDLLDMYKYTQKGILNEVQLAECFDVAKVLVGGAVYNSSAEGQTFSGSYIWANHALLLYVPPNPGKLVPAAGYTFVWGQDGYRIPITRVVDEFRDRDLLKGNHAFIQKVTGADCGYEILNAVA